MCDFSSTLVSNVLGAVINSNVLIQKQDKDDESVEAKRYLEADRKKFDVTRMGGLKKI